jgi:predicted nucleotidyltransferase
VNSLRSLAHALDVPERTLRRAALEGLVRGERVSSRRFRTSLREEDYLRRFWPLLRNLRAALRTEPNVRIAVLFGSMADGSATRSSDIDVMVDVADDDVGRLAELTGRLSRRVDDDVQVVRLADVERSPVLMAAILRTGRVLVDRDRRWHALKADEPRWHRRAMRAAVALEDALVDLETA